MNAHCPHLFHHFSPSLRRVLSGHCRRHAVHIKRVLFTDVGDVSTIDVSVTQSKRRTSVGSQSLERIAGALTVRQ